MRATAELGAQTGRWLASFDGLRMSGVGFRAYVSAYGPLPLAAGGAVVDHVGMTTPMGLPLCDLPPPQRKTACEALLHTPSYRDESLGGNQAAERRAIKSGEATRRSMSRKASSTSPFSTKP